MRATTWFTSQIVQDTRANISQLPVIVAVGPNVQPEPDKRDKERQRSQKVFEVGKTEIGGDEVVG